MFYKRSGSTAKPSDSTTGSLKEPSDTAKPSDSMKPADSTTGSVQQPAAPSTNTPDTGSTTGSAPAKDPGMRSKPGDVTGQPTDTQKPVDKDQPVNQPPNK